MRLWFDTEFIDTGDRILPLSVGVVRDDGATYYAEVEETPIDEANDWVRENVLPKMQRFNPDLWSQTIQSPIKAREQIARQLVDFAGFSPEWWAYVDEYDWVTLSQLYGSLVDRPATWPWRCRDVRELFDLACMAGEPEEWVPPPANIHQALADAKWDKALWRCIQRFVADEPDLCALVLT